jgi:hypothetical protein
MIARTIRLALGALLWTALAAAWAAPGFVTQFQGTNAAGSGTFAQAGCIPPAANGVTAASLIFRLGPINTGNGRAPFAVTGQIAMATSSSAMPTFNSAPTVALGSSEAFWW